MTAAAGVTALPAFGEQLGDETGEGDPCGFELVGGLASHRTFRPE